MIDFPAQLHNETPKAYSALLDYVQLGKDRSLGKLRQNYGKTTAYIRQLETWSTTYAWVERARAYDAELARAAAAQHEARYLADLEDHRKRASQGGKALYSVASKLLLRLDAQVQTVEVNTNTLSAVKSAMQAALDLEAHALGIDQIMEKLTDDSE